jgi:molybdopterin synthase catalytic subunit
MIKIVTGPIDHQRILESVESPEAGAVVLFDGMVRNHARGRKVSHLFYESYVPMALKELEKICAKASDKWPIRAISIIHRVGRIEIGESSVLIAVSSAHRSDAFEACRFAIDRLKMTVPIWKKEYYEDGEVWIEEYGGG